MKSRKPRSSSVREEGEAEAIPLVALVVGPEDVLREAAVADLRSRALADGVRDFNEDRFDLAASGADPAAILAAAQTLPVMAERRVVLVRGLEDRRAKRFTEDLLPGYLEAPIATTLLLLEASGADKRLRWVKQVKATGRIIDCTGPRRPADVRRWIEARIAQVGAEAARETAAALFDAVGADLDHLATEIDKLALYAGSRTELTPDDVAELTGQLRPLAVYELTDAIGNRRRPQALHVLGRLYDQGDPPLAVLGALANHFRRLIRARDCRPGSAKELERALELHPYAAQKLYDQVRRFDPPRLRRALEAIHRADRALKGGEALSPRLAIERLVLAVAS